MTDNITNLENTLENALETLIIEDVQPVVKKIGRPRKPVDENAPPKKEYYIRKNTKPTGRPVTKTQEELQINARRLEHEYSLRRGKLIVKISYIINKYKNISEELKNLPQGTQDEVEKKYVKLYDFDMEFKKNNLINKTRNSNIKTTITNTI